MKFISWALIIMLIAVWGCGISRIGHQYEYQEPNVKINSNIGYLKVHTIKYEETGDQWDDPVYKFYKGYTIYPRENNSVIDVKKSFREPSLVQLKEGEYVVLAELYDNIIYSMQVRIEKGKILEIDKSMVEEPFTISKQN